jgi:ClpP class serine protease
LAISSDAIRHDVDGFFLMLNGNAPDNEAHGSVTIVHVRGALQQFASPFGDSYEAIVTRVAAAFASDPQPSAVVLCISSPGGVVAGLNECVAKLQKMSKAAKIPLIAYVGELAASAAFGLCCACEERVSPPSGVCGSIGVISTMVSVAKNDEKNGVEFRIITSGKRKADGHLHMPISDDAAKAEAARNAELAAQFFALAGKALDIAPTKLASLEAAIYLGKDAKRVGLVDDVMGLDEAIYGLDKSETPPPVAAPNEGNITDRRARNKSLDKRAELRSSIGSLTSEMSDASRLTKGSRPCPSSSTR